MQSLRDALDLCASPHSVYFDPLLWGFFMMLIELCLTSQMKCSQQVESALSEEISVVSTTFLSFSDGVLLESVRNYLSICRSTVV